jgi:hypothetical protein
MNALDSLLLVSLLGSSSGDHHLQEWGEGLVLYLRSTSEDGTDLDWCLYSQKLV